MFNNWFRPKHLHPNPTTHPKHIGIMVPREPREEERPIGLAEDEEDSGIGLGALVAVGEALGEALSTDSAASDSGRI